MSIRDYRNTRDIEYRAALGLSHGEALPSSLGTISHGGTASSRKRAARSSFYRRQLDSVGERGINACEADR